MAQWADYSGGRPSGAALKAAGFTGVIRYVGLGSSGKRITAAEYQDLTGSGVQVLLVAEQGTTDAWGGYSAGVANAQAALNDARSLGIPDSVPIFAAADSHATTSQVDAAVQYARGFRYVLGKSRAGFYGFSETLDAVRADGSVTYYWRCGSQPSLADQSWVHFWQRNTAPTTVTVSGVSCDINVQYQPITQAAPPPAPIKDFDMPDRELRPSANGSVTLVVPSDADELVISLGWTYADVLKVAFFGPTPGMAPPAVDQLWATTGSQRDDAARPWRIPLAPARAKGEVLTCEVDYVLAPIAGRDVTGTAGFRKYA